MSPTRSYSMASTTLSASLSMTSWPRRSSSSSTLGLTFTRSLRPPVKMSAVPSSLRLQEDTEAGRRLCEPVDLLLEGHDLVAGLAERVGEPLVLCGHAGQVGLQLDDPLFENPRMTRRVGELASQDGDLLLEIGNLAGGVFGPSPGPDAAVHVVVVGCHGPHLLQGELDAS